MKTMFLSTALVFVLAFTIALPVFAGTPKTPADCQRIYEGNDESIQACIDSLRK